MEDNLAAEIARIEAELEADRQYREKQQQQSQSQLPFGSQGVVSAFGATASQQQQQQQQQFPHSQTGANHMTAVQHQQPQQLLQHGSPGVAVATSGQPHHFSKDSDGRSVFVGNLPKGDNGGPTSTPEELAQFFAECGQILNCTLLRDRTTGELKGTAYVEFASYTGMGKAIDTKNNSNFKGSTIIVTKKRSAFRPERARGGRGNGGRGGAAAGGDPYQAMMALMGMMAGSAMVQRGGRGGRGGRGRGSASGYAPAAGSFQPFQ